MKSYDVQSIYISATRDHVHEFVSKPENLPKWTNAFAQADSNQAEMRTPSGSILVTLKTESHPEAGTVDWHMGMPDGSVGHAYSRVTGDGKNASIFSFVLMAPPVPLERLEGALAEQMKTLSSELKNLKGIIESNDRR